MIEEWVDTLTWFHVSLYLSTLGIDFILGTWNRKSMHKVAFSGRSTSDPLWGTLNSPTSVVDNTQSQPIWTRSFQFWGFHHGFVFTGKVLAISSMENIKNLLNVLVVTFKNLKFGDMSVILE